MNIDDSKLRQDASLKFIDLNSTLVNLTVGEIEQVFTLSLDTELTYAWLPSNKSTIAHTNNTYKCQDACEISDQVRSIDYKDINITGVLTTDYFDFDFGDGEFKMQFLNALADVSVLPNADGSIGIGPKSYGVEGEQGLIESLQKANIIDRPIVALDYARYQIRIGDEFEDDYMDRKIMEWINTVPESNQWEIPIKSYKIKNTEIITPTTGIISSTTKQLVAPSSAYELYVAELQKKCKNPIKIHDDNTYLACEIYYSSYLDEYNNTIYYCSVYGMSGAFPNLQFTFLNHTYTIEREQFLYAYETGNRCMAVLNMLSRKDNEQAWIFGYPMLHSHYIILDYASQRVGISGQEHIIASVLLICLLLVI
jgi:hypothetical protein